MGFSLRVAFLFLALTGVSGQTLISFSTNPGNAASSTCACSSFTSGVCDDIPSGCFHGQLLKFQGSSAWTGTPAMSVTTLDYHPADLPITPPVCSPVVNGVWLTCALYAPSNGQFKFEIGGTSASIVLNVTAPEFIEFEQLEDCRGAPGIGLVDCDHGARLKARHQGMDAFVGTYAYKDASPAPQITFFGGDRGAQCISLTIDYDFVHCLLAVYTEDTMTMLLHLKPSISGDANAGTTVTANSLAVRRARGISADHTYPYQGNLTLVTRLPQINSITGDCKSFSQRWNPHFKIAKDCIHGGVIYLHGHGLRTLNGTFRTDSGNYGPTCFYMEVVDQDTIKCYVDTSLPSNWEFDQLTVDGVAFNSHFTSTISAGDITVSIDVVNNVKVSFIRPTITSIATTDGCMYEDSSKLLTGCYGLYTITVYGTGFYKSDPALNFITFRSQGGLPQPSSTQRAPKVSCFNVSLTHLECELDAPPDIDLAALWQLSVTSIGLTTETDLYIQNVLPGLAQYTQPVAYASAVVANGTTMYVIGGEDAAGNGVSEVGTYLPAENYGYTSMASLPVPRSCASAVGVPDNATLDGDNRWIYVLGGTEDTDNSTSCLGGKQADRDVYVYDAWNDAAGWTKLESQVPPLGRVNALNMSNLGPQETITGIMFDVTVHEDIVVSGLDVAMTTTGGGGWKVYMKIGTYVGAVASDWTLVTEVTTPASVGTTGRKRLPVDFELELTSGPGAYAFYIYCDNGGAPCQGAHRDDHGLHVVAPSSPEMTVMSGVEADASFGVVTPWLFEFDGAFVISRSAHSCLSWEHSGTGAIGTAFTIETYTQARWMDKAVKVAQAEFSVQLTVTGTPLASQFTILILKPNGQTFSVLASAPGVALASGHYRFTDAAATPLSTLTAFPNIGTSTRLQPSEVQPASSLRDFFAGAGTAGDFKVQFKDLAADANTVTVDRFQLRVCMEQPGLAAAASCAVDDKVYTVGGVGSGAFVYENVDSQTIAAQSSIKVPVNAEGFGTISSLKVGVAMASTAMAEDLRMYLTIPPVVQAGIIGEWFADGTTFDVSAHGRHGVILANRSYFSESECKTNGYPHLNLLDGWVTIPNMPKPQVESRAVWMKLGTGETGAFTLMGWGNHRHIWQYSALSVRNGKLTFREMVNLYYICEVQVPSDAWKVNDGQWHHVAMTRDASNRVYLFVDGAVRTWGQCTQHVPSSELDSFEIGRLLWKDGTYDVFAGALYDARIYDVALTDSEVAELMKGGCGGQVWGLVTTSATTTAATAFNVQTFSTRSGSPIAMSNTDFPSSNPATVFEPAESMEHLFSAVGGKWQLTIQSVHATNTPSYKNWAVEVIGTQQFPSSGTAVFGLSTEALRPIYEPKGFGAMHVPRYGHGLVTIDGYLYAIGGASTGGNNHKSVATVEVMDTTHTRPNWVYVASMNTARFMPAVTVIDRKIYAVGGRAADGTLLTDTEEYDPATNVWTTLTTHQLHHQSLVYGREGAFSAAAYGRLFVGGGFNSRGEATSTVDAVDLQAKQPCWLRETDVDLVSGCVCSQTLGGCETSSANWDMGYLYFGAEADEAACVARCDASPRCYAYTYKGGECHGRVEVGHQCTAVSSAGAKSGIRACKAQSKTTSTPWKPEANVQYVYFDVVVPANTELILKGITLNLATGDDQQIAVLYKSGTYSGASSTDWTHLTPYEGHPVQGYVVTPASPGRYHMPLEFSQTLTTGTHGFYVYAQYPGSLLMSTSVTTSAESWVQLRAGGSRTIQYGGVVTAGLLNVGLHLTPGSSWKPHSPRTSCYFAPSNVTTIGHRDLPVTTKGFSIFARVYIHNVLARQGVFYKAYKTVGVAGMGGFGVSLVQGYLRLSTMYGWVTVGHALSIQEWYNLQFSYDGIDTWTIVISDRVYTQVAPMPKQSEMKEVTIGSEDGANKWQGVIEDVSIDCGFDQGPSMLVGALYPATGMKGVLSYTSNTIQMTFSDPVEVVGGYIYLTTSVWEGLHDKNVIQTERVELTSDTVTIASNVLTVKIPANFTHGVRYQISTDVGALRLTTDATFYQGLTYEAPEEGVWWFAVSDKYRTLESCGGEPCAVCSACEYKTTRDNGDKVYWCYINTDHTGMFEVQKLNVETLPTVDCP